MEYQFQDKAYRYNPFVVDGFMVEAFEWKAIHYCYTQEWKYQIPENALFLHLSSHTPTVAESK